MQYNIENALKNVRKTDVPNSTFVKVEDVLQNLEHRKDVEYLKPKTKKPAVIAAAVAVMAVALCGAAFAGQIFDHVTARLSVDNSVEPVDIADISAIEIDGSIPVNTGTGFMPMTVGEVEDMLGLNVLTSSNAGSEQIGYDTLLTDGNIARIDLWYAGFIEYENDVPENHPAYKQISQSAVFLTQYADERYRLPFAEGIDATGGKQVSRTYHIDALDAYAVLYTNDWSEYRLSAAFVYENILYTFIGNNVSETEMIDILESLS